MLRTGILLMCYMTIVLQTVAQNMKVFDFKLLEQDLTANTRGTQKVDMNGEIAALIKIQTPERGFTFDGGVLGIVAAEEHEGEIWLYIPRRSMKLTIHHKNYGVLRDYVYPVPIQGGRTYEMFIDIGIGRYFTITSQIARSLIYIDGENVGEAPIHNKYLNYGHHTIRALKDRFEGEDTVIITTDEEEQRRVININQRDMSDHFGDVTVMVENRADIFFEGKNVGTGQWKTQLREGNYTIETRKADSDPVKTSFTVVAQQQNDVKATPPIPHTGYLNIFTRPRNVITSPYNLNETITLPVGTHHLELSKKGYVTQNREYTILRNEITYDTVTLERVTYVKPLAFYFGAGYCLRSISGLTGFLGAVIKGHDIQASYTLGLSASDPIYWYTTDGIYDYLSGCTYKMSSIALRYGYQFNLSDKLAITPQMGSSIDLLSVSENDAKQAYADGASSTCLTIGLKLLYVPFEHCYLFLAPEYDIALKQDANYEHLSSFANINAGGLLVHGGVLVNF